MGGATITILVFIIFLFLLLIGAIIKGFREDDWYDAGSLLLASIFGLIVSGLAFYPIYEYENVEYTKHICNIKTLKPMGNEISGSGGGFIIGFGSIETTNYYYYFEELENNKSKFGKIEADNTIIIETNDYKPHIMEVKNKNSTPHYEMYVPVGTIQIEWEL